ncbi:MAG: hypothetical protein GY714_12635 [Desulfobacterales bacterium]|nr:hypothetical protein [Desulfobacterales bacterium]
MKKNLFGIISLILLVLMFQSTIALANKQISKVEVMGVSAIIRGNESEAKKLAIKNSLKSAVEKVIVELLSTDILISNFKAMNDLIYLQTSDYIEGYKVLSEFKHKKKYRVFVSADVSIRKVLNNLSKGGFILEKENLPTILLLVSEKNTDLVEKYWWKGEAPYEKSVGETTLESEITKRGYSLIAYDYGIIKKIENLEKAGKKETKDKTKEVKEKNLFILNNATAIKIGTQMNADVVIVGSVIAKKSPNKIGDDHTFKGFVKIRAIFTKDGSEFTKVHKIESSVNPDEKTGGDKVIAKTVSAAGEKIASTIMKKWQVAKNKPTLLNVEITGKNYLRNFAHLKNVLRQMDGLKDIKTKKFRSNGATLAISYKGNGKLFAESLILQNISRFGLNITDIKDDSLKIQMVPLR